VTTFFISAIIASSIAGVIIRPFKLPEAVWAVTGAALLVLFGLITLHDGLLGVLKGTDVYLFLTGMMLLSETAREEKLFEWFAAKATKASGGSGTRLFLLVYLVGLVVTIFLSNDATAVVLTPAVAAATKSAKVENPLPYLFICAFVANAASFVLPISNPANLVIYGSHLPSLSNWIPQYILPSLVSVMATYGLLFFSQRKNIRQAVESSVDVPRLSLGGKISLWGIAITAYVLLACSAKDMQLGAPTAIMGLLTSAVVLIFRTKSPMELLRAVSWSVLPLVAGLFVLVEGLIKTGIIKAITGIIQNQASHALNATAWTSGLIVATASNLMNNLPVGLIAGEVFKSVGHVDQIQRATLIGIDLGPNLSITGSLATLLWLVALRREGQNVGAWDFLKLGAFVMTLTLIMTLATVFI